MERGLVISLEQSLNPTVQYAQNHGDQASCYFENLRVLAKKHEIPVFSINQDIDDRTDGIEKRLSDPKKLSGLPTELKRTDQGKLKLAGAYFAELVKPMIATGKDAYKPTEEDVFAFCQRMANGVGVDLVMYYALSKTRSPRRTGSPDTLIDFAELEMLKRYALMTRTAQNLGLKLTVTIVDEADAVPDDNYSGFNGQEKETNRELVRKAIGRYRASELVRVRSLVESVTKPLGDDFPSLYAEEYQYSAQRALEQIRQQQVSALSIRAFTFLDCMPNSGLEALGLTTQEIEEVRSLTRDSNLSRLPEPLLRYIIHFTAHIAAIMSLRGTARARVITQGQLSHFPEYNEDQRVYGGITRSTDRWSFLPHPTRNMGRVINPMHGLALYSNDTSYSGVVPFHELIRLQEQEKGRVVYLGEKPIFGTLET